MNYSVHHNEMVVEDLRNIVSEAKVKFASRKAMALVGGGIAIVVLLIVFLLLGVIMLSSRDCAGSATAALAGKATQDYCLDPTCLESASFVAKNRDATVNPCEDFYKYSCQGWQKKTALPPEFGYSSILDHMALDNEEKWRSMLESPVSTSGAPASEKKLKDFFSHCLHDYGRNDDGVDLVQAIRTYLGGWYVLDPQNWNANWNMDRAVANAHVEFLIGIHFDYDIWPDSTGVRNNILTILPESIGMNDMDYTDPTRASIRTAYRNYIKTVGGLLLKDANITISSSERDSRLETFVNDVMDHEGRLAQYHSETVYNTVRATLGDLARNYTQIHWVQILSTVFSQAGISSSTKVQVNRPDYFRTVDNALRDEGSNRDRIINNFMVWRIAHIYTSTLSWEYRNARYDYIRARTGYTEFPNTWESCLWVTKARMSLAMAAMFVHKHIDTNSPQEVEKLVGDLRSFAVQKVSGLKWMDDQTKTIAKYKLSNMDVIVGFPKVIKDADRFEALYDQLKVNKSESFFKNILYSNEFLRFQLSHELTEDYKDSMWRYSVLHSGMGIRPLYYWFYNSMLVPPGSLLFPMYDQKMSKAMVYGGMGHFIGERLVHTFDSIGRYILNGTYNTWWTEATKMAYRNTSQCLVDFYKEKKAGPYLVDGEQKYVNVDGSSQMLRAIAKTYGMQIAFQTYQANAINTPQQLLPGLNLTQQQLFFVSVAQLQCSKRRDLESYYMATGGILPDNILVNGIMAQTPDFHKAFNCPDNSPLKPKKICPLI